MSSFQLIFVLLHILKGKLNHDFIIHNILFVLFSKTIIICGTNSNYFRFESRFFLNFFVKSIVTVP